VAYDPDWAEEELAKAGPDLQEYVKRLKEAIDAASQEVVRLQGVIREHVTRASGNVVGNFRVDTLVTIDDAEVRTVVKVEPMLHEFRLAEPLVNWSADHKAMFHKTVVQGFSERTAKLIGDAIWNADLPKSAAN
jgi:hypothetical protein